jgi:methyl-accepting chemotaxis protein/methyl-accepting chemotaxis protein-1 (serine sensor receptor)
MTIKKKLFLSYGLLGSLTLVAGASCILMLHRIGLATKKIGVDCGDKMYQTALIDGSVSEADNLRRGIALRLLDNKPDQAEAMLRSYVKQLNDIDGNLGVLRKIGLNAQEQSLVDQMNAPRLQLLGSVAQYTQIMRTGDAHALMMYSLHELNPRLDAFKKAAADFTLVERQLMADTNAEVQGQEASAYWLMGTLLALSLVVGVMLVFIILDLDRQLRRSVEELLSGSSEVLNAAGQVSEASQTLATAASQQAAMIEETSANTQEIRASATSNEKSADAAQRYMQEVQEQRTQVEQALTDCVTAMDAIGGSSKQIGKALELIESIAFQTNILALNASVEAARAGVAGAGFSVVADEVRSLAQRCAEASKSISALVGKSLDDSARGRSCIQRVVGSNDQTTEVFVKVKVLIDQLGSNSKGQAGSVDQIANAMHHIEQATQSNAAIAEENSAASYELTSQSEALRSVATTLEEMVGASV